MKEIVKVLLQEGIDIDTIHEVLNVIEENYEIVSETKKANKLAHQQAIYNKLNPQGASVLVRKDEISTPKQKEAVKRLTRNPDHKLRKGSNLIIGTAHAMQDFRDSQNTDSPQSAPHPQYDFDKGTEVIGKSANAEKVRDVLGRDDTFSKS